MKSLFSISPLLVLFLVVLNGCSLNSDSSRDTREVSISLIPADEGTVAKSNPEIRWNYNRITLFVLDETADGDEILHKDFQHQGGNTWTATVTLDYGDNCYFRVEGYDSGNKVLVGGYGPVTVDENLSDVNVPVITATDVMVNVISDMNVSAFELIITVGSAINEANTLYEGSMIRDTGDDYHWYSPLSVFPRSNLYFHAFGVRGTSAVVLTDGREGPVSISGSDQIVNVEVNMRPEIWPLFYDDGDIDYQDYQGTIYVNYFEVPDGGTAQILAIYLGIGPEGDGNQIQPYLEDDNSNPISGIPQFTVGPAESYYEFPLFDENIYLDTGFYAGMRILDGEDPGMGWDDSVTWSNGVSPFWVLTGSGWNWVYSPWCIQVLVRLADGSEVLMSPGDGLPEMIPATRATMNQPLAPLPRQEKAGASPLILP